MALPTARLPPDRQAVLAARSLFSLLPARAAAGTAKIASTSSRLDFRTVTKLIALTVIQPTMRVNARAAKRLH